MKMIALALALFTFACSTVDNSANIKTTGDWVRSDGQFHSVASAEKANKIHFSRVFKNAEITFEIKAKDLANFSFYTKTELGNLFRFSIIGTQAKYCAWNNAHETRYSVILRSEYDLEEDIWVPVKFTCKGKELSMEVGVGDESEYAVLEDLSFDKEKVEFSIECTGGALSVRNINFKVK